MTVCLGQISKQEPTDESAQSGDVRPSLTCAEECDVRINLWKRNLCIWIFAECSAKGETDNADKDSTGPRSASLQILPDWIRACSADNVKFVNRDAANYARAKWAAYMLTSSRQWMQDDSVEKQVLGGPDGGINGMWSFWNSWWYCWGEHDRGALGLKSLNRKARTYSLCRTAGQECRPSVCGICVAWANCNGIKAWEYCVCNKQCRVISGVAFSVQHA